MRDGGHLLEDVGEQAGDEAVEEHGLGEREAQPLDAGDLVAHLGLAGDRLDHLAEDDADADARADRAETAADRDPEARPSIPERRREREDVCKDNIRELLVVLVVSGGAGDVDRGQGREDERLQRGHQAELEQVDRGSRPAARTTRAPGARGSPRARRP